MGQAVKEGRWYDRAIRECKSRLRKPLIRIYVLRPSLFRRIRRLFSQDDPHKIYLDTKNDLRPRAGTKNDRLSELAHSRPALQVEAPAFCRHAVFFFPHIPREYNPTLHPGNFDRKKAMERLGKLVAKLVGRTEAETLGELAERFRADESCIFKCTYLKFDLRIVIDVYSEYATLSLVLDNSTGLSSDAAVDDLTAIATYIRQQIDAHRSSAPKDFEPHYSEVEAVYFGIWKLLDHDKETQFSQSGIGPMVGDFRGFAICPSGCDAVGTTPAERDKLNRFAPGLEERPLQDPMLFLRCKKSFFLDCLGLDEHASILYDDSRSAKRIEPNVILCYMLGGDGIYGSALGNRQAHRHGREHATAPTPITYFVIHNGKSPNQLGRMIRRQNLLGELRIAALLDAETIITLGAPIRKLSGLVSNLLTHGTRASAIPRRDFDEVLQLYTEIGRKCHGGFLYRMARAKYYYEALQKRIEDLRYEPISGWQSYPGFISRHFDQRFRSMRSTGERYIDVGKRIERIFTLYGQTRSTLRTVFTSLLAATSLATTISVGAYTTFLKGHPGAGRLAVALFLSIVAAGSLAVYSLQDSIDRRKYLPYVVKFLIVLIALGAVASVLVLFNNDDLLKAFVQRLSELIPSRKSP
jgi:hypothetical protein